MTQRERFEQWVSAPPFERSTERQGTNTAWPEVYADIAVDLAWEAWQEAEKQAAEAHTMGRYAVTVCEKIQENGVTRTRITKVFSVHAPGASTAWAEVESVLDYPRCYVVDVDQVD